MGATLHLPRLWVFLMPPCPLACPLGIIHDTPLLDEAGDAPLRVILHPSSRPAVERLLTSASGLPLVIVEEPTLAAGQVYLQLGQSELRVDVDSAVKEILGAVHDFFEFAEKESEIG